MKFFRSLGLLPAILLLGSRLPAEIKAGTQGGSTGGDNTYQHSTGGAWFGGESIRFGADLAIYF